MVLRGLRVVVNIEIYPFIFAFDAEYVFCLRKCAIVRDRQMPTRQVVLCLVIGVVEVRAIGQIVASRELFHRRVFPIGEKRCLGLRSVSSINLSSLYRHTPLINHISS